MLMTTRSPSPHTIRPVHISREGFSRVMQQPVANYVGDSVLLEPLDDTSGWSTSQCSMSYDTSNYKCGDTNFQSIKLTPNGTSITNYITKTISATNLTGTHGMLRIFIPEGSGDSHYEKIEMIYVVLMDSLGNNRAYYVWHPPAWGYRGWSELNFLTNEFGYESGTPPDMSDITVIRLYVKTLVSTYTPAVVFDQIEFYNPENTKGLVLVRMDGPYDRAWQACAYMQAQKLTGTSRKLRASICVSTSLVGTGGRLDLAQIKGLQQAGHFIMMYLSAWNITAQADKLPLLDGWQEWMSENGFGSGVRYVAHSGSNAFTYEDRIEIAPARFDAVFGGQDEYKNAVVRGLWNPRWCQWSHFSGAANLSDRISRAAAQQGLLILGAHCVDAGELTQFKTDIDAIVTEINNGTLVPVTFHELVSGAGLVQ